MHETLLSQAALPAPTVVFGLLMRPFSLGHELFLSREGNPLATCASAKGVTAVHLAQACLICCQSWDENRRAPLDFMRWLKIKVWRWTVRKANVREEIEKFLLYRNLGEIEFPPSDIARFDRPSGREPGTPFLLRLQQWLMITFRLSEAEAWDYPSGLAKMRWAAFWEQEGGLDIKNAHEAEFEAFVAEQEAKGAAQI